MAHQGNYQGPPPPGGATSMRCYIYIYIWVLGAREEEESLEALYLKFSQVAGKGDES